MAVVEGTSPPQVQQKETKRRKIMTLSCHSFCHVAETHACMQSVHVVKTPATAPASALLSETDENEIPKVEINSDDVVALPYSSGTTGSSSGWTTLNTMTKKKRAWRYQASNNQYYLKYLIIYIFIL